MKTKKILSNIRKLTKKKGSTCLDPKLAGNIINWVILGSGFFHTKNLVKKFLKQLQNLQYGVMVTSQTVLQYFLPQVERRQQYTLL